jgi:hypothetical protein
MHMQLMLSWHAVLQALLISNVLLLIQLPPC